MFGVFLMFSCGIAAIFSSIGVHCASVRASDASMWFLGPCSPSGHSYGLVPVSLILCSHFGVF